MTFGATLVNQIWHGSTRATARTFWQAIRHPAETQERLLRRYLATNRDTEYGQRWGFDRLHSVDSFQRAIPLTTYDDYADAITRIGQGEQRVLTAAPVQLFELSSGSTAASKLIPYTAPLTAEFQRGLAPWIADLFTQEPALKGGPAYWSITPLTGGRRTTPAGIPIGFAADSAYLGPLGRLIEAVLAVPNGVKQIGEMSAFRYVTLLFLLRRADLRLISVWNPTFLTLLLEPLPGWWESLLHDIGGGTLTPPTPIDPALATQLGRWLKPAPRRARELARLQPHHYRSLWPQLALISCWADGPATTPAQQLAAHFPGVRIQGKGLLATEAFVTLPVDRAPGGVLAINAHFFEFLGLDGEPRLAHQLTPGGSYEVVVTTGGGFYRYQLHDQVEVVGFLGQTPCLRFVAKSNRMADRFGEKLNEGFVAGVLAQLFARYGLHPRFSLLAPAELPTGVRYVLYLELEQPLPDGLAQALDQALAANFHYDYCRRLGQLAAAQVQLIRHGAQHYLAVCQARGQRLGAIKPAVLDPQPGWEEHFGIENIEENG